LPALLLLRKVIGLEAVKSAFLNVKQAKILHLLKVNEIEKELPVLAASGNRQAILL
jgi:hypothetical protein